VEVFVVEAGDVCVDFVDCVFDVESQRVLFSFQSWSAALLKVVVYGINLGRRSKQ
jgi:hypothetical protein